MVFNQIHLRLLMLSTPNSFHIKTWAIMMESTRQKTFKLLRTVLSLSVFLIVILLLSHALSIPCSFKVVRVVDCDTLKVDHNCKAGTILLSGIDAPEDNLKMNLKIICITINGDSDEIHTSESPANRCR